MEIVLNGNLTKDPEIKYFESGKSITNFSIAVNGFKNGEKTVSFYNCKHWDNEFVCEHYKKGQNITVIGYLKKEIYENKKKEVKINHNVIVNMVVFGFAYGITNKTTEKIEKKYKNEKSYQLIKMVDDDMLYFNYTKNELEENKNYTISGFVEMEDNTPIMNISKLYNVNN